MTTVDALLTLFETPAQAGRRAMERRAQRYGRVIRVLSGNSALRDPWPPPQQIREGERVAISIAPTPAAREAFAQWLIEAGRHGPSTWSLAPSAPQAAGLHPLWCIAAARLALPLTVRVEARHDLLSIRLAQIALGFGADTFSGPLDDDRKLPLAGITRPSEATPRGLATLIEQAGFEPRMESPA